MTAKIARARLNEFPGLPHPTCEDGGRDGGERGHAGPVSARTSRPRAAYPSRGTGGVVSLSPAVSFSVLVVSAMAGLIVSWQRRETTQTTAGAEPGRTRWLTSR